jgi:eukaryotic-like serine/threonine-protein kinase
MSRVFAATETSLGRKVVVKVLPPELAEGVSVERFKREIQLAAQLQHPHIVPVLSAGEMSGLPYYTMPFVDGHSLRTRLAKGGPLPINETISTLRDVAKALAYAHERGVVHRDIKPDNVLITSGSAVVTDFGVAKALSVAKMLAPGGTLTQVGTSLGTPAYMAPEQVAADAGTNHRADLYAFGVMAYEMLAAHPPFFGKTGQKLLAAQLSERPEPIEKLRPDTPPLLAQLVMRCLEKDADDRPQSASDLVHVLESVTSGSGMPAMPEILLGGRRRLWRALGLYAVVFAGVAIVAKAAIVAIGLPDWVFFGAIVVMALGLPVILFTAFVHHGAHQAFTTSSHTPGGSPAVQSTMHSTMTRIAVKASPWVSWRKTALGGGIALSVFALLVLGFMTLRALGIGPAGSLLAAGKLKNQEPLLVTDFRARGADSSLGSAITEAVRTDLGQSSVISLVSPSDVAAALGRMRRAETSRLDLSLARELAQREGIKAIVDGDLTPLSGGYLVTLRLVGAERGTELASFHQAVDGPRELIPAIDKLTRELRGRIGESLRTVQSSPALEQVTTPSLDALRKYVAGVHANDFEGDYPKAIALLNDAVSLDTTFAMAYRKLGVAIGNNTGGQLNETADSAFAKAYRFRDRLTVRERYLAIASYFAYTGRDRPQAAAAYEALLRRDSLDDIAMTDLANVFQTRREFSRAESLFSRLITAGRAGHLEYGGVVDVRIDQGELAKADSALGAMRAAFPASPRVAERNFELLYAEGRLDSLSVLLTKGRTSDRDPGNRAFATHQLANLAMLHGRLGESQRLEADAVAQDVSRGVPPPPLSVQLDSAWLEIWFREQPARGIGKLDAALALVPLRSLRASERPYLRIAQLYALAGRPDRARALLTQYAAEVKDSALIRDREPDRRNALAEIALVEHRPTDAVVEFRRGDERPDGPADECAPCLPARLGRAYDQANLPDSAIAADERYISTPYWAKLSTSQDPALLAGMHKRLGELYEAKSDERRALEHYGKFVELWKDADPELEPQLADVKRRMARLRDTQRR